MNKKSKSGVAKPKNKGVKKIKLLLREIGLNKSVGEAAAILLMYEKKYRGIREMFNLCYFRECMMNQINFFLLCVYTLAFFFRVDQFSLYHSTS